MIGTFRIGAVILAGGRGSRMHSDIQKQYMLLNGRPLISYALEAFEQSIVDAMVLVTGAGEEDYVRQEILAPLHLKKLCGIVTGGKERYHSVYEGLKALQKCDYVLIHDGARPLVTGEIISRAAYAAMQDGACVVGMPVKDTIKVADPDGFQTLAGADTAGIFLSAGACGLRPSDGGRIPSKRNHGRCHGSGTFKRHEGPSGGRQL